MRTEPLRSDQDWIKWGERDPLWAVATWKGRARTDPNPWTDDDFSARGERDWVAYRLLWSRYGLNDSGACLEIGCGAGRVTRAIAKSFPRVEAVDVSPGMLDYARRNVTAAHVHFHQTSGTALPLAAGSVTAVLSTFVFQHLDHPSVGMAYLESIHRVMASGATLMVQLPLLSIPPLHNTAGGLLREGLRLTFAVRAQLADRLAWLRRLGGARVMRHTIYEADQLLEELPRMGFSDVQLVVTSKDVQWLFARRP